MPLQGTGNILGDILAKAVGAPDGVGGFFKKVGAAIATWAPENVVVKPGAMAAASGAVAGLGFFETSGEDELGNLIADKIDIPADAESARARWVSIAKALIDHFNNFGQANGTGLTSGVPACGGKGKVQFTAPQFVPPLSVVLEVTEPVSAAALEGFGAQLLAHIATNADVIAISIREPFIPLSAPPDGPVVGAGSIA